MMAHQVLITGANRGLGLEFTKQYTADGWNVLACCRHPQSAMQLQALAQTKPSIKIVTLDVADFAQIDALALQLKDLSIDLLINNAGVYPSSSFGNVDYNEWHKALKLTAWRPLKWRKRLFNRLPAASLKKLRLSPAKWAA